MNRHIATQIATALFAIITLAAGTASADPCTRIPDRGPIPAEARNGQTFSGPVRYVGDGDGLCVETLPGIGGAGWVEVRLADFYAPEISEPGGVAARQALTDLVMGRTIECRAGRRSWDRVVARCTLDGMSLGDRLRALGGAEGGRGRR